MELEEKIIKLLLSMRYSICDNVEKNIRNKEQLEILNKLKEMNTIEIGEAIREGINLEENKEEKFSYSKKVPLINYDNTEENEFCIYKEMRYNGYSFDVVITINKIPIALIEICRDVESGAIQLQRCMQYEYMQEELKTVQLLVIIDNKEIKYKINDDSSNWRIWNIENKEKSLIEEKVASFFDKNTLLKLIKDYSILIDGKREIATYYQYIATEKVMENIKQNKKSKIYLASGSGKTMSILYLIKKLQKQKNEAKILLLVDRLELQDMIRIRIGQANIENVKVANSKLDLENLLNQTNTKIIITTIQKLVQYEKPYLGLTYIITNIVGRESEEFLDFIASKIFEKSKTIMYTNRISNKEELLYSYTFENAIQDNIITKVLYYEIQIAEQQKISHLKMEISSKYLPYSVRTSQIIIITDKNKLNTYIKELGEIKSIATISNLEENNESKDKQFLEDIIRENGTLINYRKESLNNFNNGKLDILLVTKSSELRNITSQNVRTIYLDKTINEEMLEQILDILYHRNKKNKRAILIDYANNKEKIYEMSCQTEYQAIEKDISKIIHEARIPFLNLARKQRYIEDKMKTIDGLNEIYFSNEIEIFLEDIKNWIEKLLFIYSSEECLSHLEKEEKESFQDRFLKFLDTVDKICIIYIKEIEWTDLVKELCSYMKIEQFCFTKLQKSDLWKIDTLQGTWKKLREIQKIEAIKNRLKLYIIGQEKTHFDILLEKYQKKQIGEIEYKNEIEKSRNDFIKKMQIVEMPLILKDNKFDLLLYSKIKDMSYLEKIKILNEDNLAQMIIEIRKSYLDNIKIDWLQNRFLCKKIENNVIEIIYYYIDNETIMLSEMVLDELLKQIQNIAFQEINITFAIDKKELFYIKKKNAYAVGEKRDNGFLVLKNSTTVDGFSDGLDNYSRKRGKELREKGIIVDNRFVCDYEFKSSSAAANIILGRNSNGRIEWKES